MADYEPTPYGGYVVPRRRAGFHVGGTEVLHLLIALSVLILAFTFFLGGYRYLGSGLIQQDSYFDDEPFIQVLIIAAVAMGTGFILHELMHKFVAQYFGHWAEFRLHVVGLALALPIVLIAGIILAAPGAVVISGWVRERENGLISAAGPFTNIVIALLAYPFTLTPGSADTLTWQIAITVMLANGVLAVFNLIPLGPLDGRKVWRWSPLAYLLMLAAAIGVILLSF